MQKNVLIKIYDHVCHKYKEQICWEVQRFSNNQQTGNITDEELMTIYLFCVAYEEKYKIKSMYRHIKTYWSSWFPTLPSYQTFNARLNKLCDAFDILMQDFFNSLPPQRDHIKIIMGDSFPVVTCSHKRKAKVARDLVDKGFCASKNLHYYGIKVHTFASRRATTIPFPQYFDITAASVHDLTASRAILEKMSADVSIVDKAYCDKELATKMQLNNNLLLTPIKDKKGWEALLKKNDQAYVDLYNKAISSVRQPIESLFNWLNELTHIQNASKVRSSSGLKLHIYGKLAAALLILSNF